jgi:hypothetical protein
VTRGFGHQDAHTPELTFSEGRTDERLGRGVGQESSSARAFARLVGIQ